MKPERGIIQILEDWLYPKVKNSDGILNVFRKLHRFWFTRCLFFSNRRMISNYFKHHQITKLQIGCASNIFEGWLNTDIKPMRNVLFLDATKKFPFDNAVFDYVFTEHLIEHLKFKDGERCIRECYRVIKPGGKMRISTPDLRFVIGLYNENKTMLQKRYIIWVTKAFPLRIRVPSDVFVINNFFRSPHKFIYDYKTLKDLLEKCGFINVIRCDVGKSSDKNLSGIEFHGGQGGDDAEFNELESMVIEGTKP